MANNRQFLWQLGSQRSRCQQICFLLRILPTMWTAAFSLCAHMAFPSCVHTETEGALPPALIRALIPSWRLIPMTSSEPNYSLKLYFQILSHWDRTSTYEYSGDTNIKSKMESEHINQEKRIKMQMTIKCFHQVTRQNMQKSTIGGKGALDKMRYNLSCNSICT